MKMVSKEVRKVLDFQWKTYLQYCAEGNKLFEEGRKLFAEGDKLYAESDKLCVEGSKPCAEGDKLYAEGSKLYKEGRKLYAEGRKLWAESILHFVGNIKLEWNGDSECKLETGDVFVTSLPKRRTTPNSGIVEVHSAKASPRSTMDAAIEKPLLEKEHKEFLTQNLWTTYFDKEDVVAAVKKHKERRFDYVGWLYKCKKCDSGTSFIRDQYGLCYDCAIEEDFGKVE